MNSRIRVWWYWLVIIVTSGLTLLGIGFSIVPDVMQSVINQVFFTPSQVENIFTEEVNSFLKFIYGVLGSVMIAWSVTLLFILAGQFRRGESEGWNTITVSILIWFIVDSAISILTGFWQNAVSNTVFLVLAAIPLTVTYGYFHNKS
jgi:hypothetical protein